MNRALYAAATGMAAQQRSLDVVADNLANAEVSGFKRARATFAALGERLGTAFTGTARSFEQGKVEPSGGPFDLALDGPGFFCVERDGRHAFTRDGAFARAADGSLRNDAGWRLSGVRVPPNAISATVAPDGSVRAVLTNGDERALGSIRIVSFSAPERLASLGSSLYGESIASGRPQPVRPGADSATHVVFGALERSNVSIVESMMAILEAQRAYEANAKGVQAADEMQRIANNLHRS